ncbi:MULTISPECIES: CAP domain-containing protein [unclassified Peribacillus]|uniref:CAP domain-containing protein n=1 Tax=unclassified Peribacillus TaxID=2675266 RepID=UPI001911E591|nr:MULTISPECIES: CAP domain-containing protein [unclassified Peribacillus]MBK5463118.1 sporulation protein [Peribacillus sp. TH27]MBK5501325.1 sporulation protein [Peribacillus sp. TH14]
MKKKMFMSAAAAAAIIFTGVGANQAEAANCDTVKQVTYKSINQEDMQKVLNQYLTKYNITLPASQSLQVQQPVQQPVQKPAQEQAQKPVQKPVQKPAGTTNSQPEKNTDEKTETSSELSAFEQQVVKLTNAERAKQGLAALKIDTELSKVARLKSQDMKDKNYFDHNSPTYGSPFDMMKKFGISYTSAGENIAQGQKTPEEVVEAWMNSQGHRENIMNSSFTHIGVGYVESGNYWTQQFIGK